ncbi:uncharacterized protein [Penaeus vannamei]|uniref:uncharacterized protein n=1 Tax=Penaeus vannamei TaxID=6689 RepID=UPI00387F8CE4
MVRGEIKIHLRRERNKLIRKPQPNLANLKIRSTEFSLNIQNRYSLLRDENLNINLINKQFNDIIKEAALEVGGKNDEQSSRKLSVETKQLMQKRRAILDSSQPREQAGILSGFSSTDHIHTLTQIKEKVNENRKPLYDIVLLSESADEMQQLINDLNRESLKVGLKMNKKKTKVMVNSRVPSEQILVQGEALEVVDKYIYLGQLVQTSTSSELEIKRRISLGWSAFSRHSSTLRAHVI